jgi:hypothetical protein
LYAKYYNIIHSFIYSYYIGIYYKYIRMYYSIIVDAQKIQKQQQTQMYDSTPRC